MPRGASPKRERAYNELKRQFKAERHDRGRAKEVAARNVNKQRHADGESANGKGKDRAGKSLDRDLPIDEYRHLTVRQVTPKLGRLSSLQLHRIRAYEHGHKDRKGVLKAIGRALHE